MRGRAEGRVGRKGLRWLADALKISRSIKALKILTAILL
jgi:hypothetical protein